MNTFKKKFLGGMAAGAAVLALSACLLPVGDGEGLDEDGNPIPPVESLESIQPLFRGTCTGCHGVGATAGLSLNSFDAAFNSFFVIENGDTLPREASTAAGEGLFRIKPGNADSSHLYQRLVSTGSIKMPPTGDPLNPAFVERIRKWINAGALIRDTTTVAP